MTSFPIINLIKEMTDIDRDKRIRISQVEQRLSNINIEIITGTSIATKLTAQNQTDLLDDLGNAEYDDIQVKLMMKER